MKVALAFLLKVRLNKILAYFVLNQCVYFIFSFILFVLLVYFIFLMFSFLLKHFIAFKEYLYADLLAQKILGKIKEFWPISLQSAEQYYFYAEWKTVTHFLNI